jgi:hypothetical protein
LNAQNVRPIEVYRQLIAVGEGVMSESNVRKWCRMFGENSTNVHNEERPGHPSLITEGMKNRTDQHNKTNRLFTLDEIHETFPQISLSLSHEIFTEYLHYQKNCAKWVGATDAPWRAQEQAFGCCFDVFGAVSQREL